MGTLHCPGIALPGACGKSFCKSLKMKLLHNILPQARNDVKLENETVWLTQAQMAVLFEKDQSVIARHIKNALSEGEVDNSNMQKVHNTLSKYKPTTVYNLDVIISVGYRVHSQRGVQFRRWANSVLKEYLIKGYAVKNNLVQQKYDDLKALVDVMGRTMGYLDSPADDQIRSIFDVVKDYTYEQFLIRYPVDKH